MRSHTALLECCALVALAARPALAPLVPGVDLPALCDHADVIVVGGAVNVREGGPTTVVIRGKSFPGRLMVVELDVEKVLKGPPKSGTMNFSFSVPSVPIVSLGYQEVLPGEFGVFFLRKKVDRGYEVFDPYHPSVVASPGAPQTPGSLLDQVTTEVAHVLASPEASIDLKEHAVWVLKDVRTPVAAAALRAATRNQPVKVQLAAIAALLARNDISVLDSAEQAMLSQDPKIDQDLKAALAYALRDGVKDPRAIPTLARLLVARDVNVRRGAAAALRNTQDGAAIRPLSEALYDNDREVQYQAVIGLAEITGTIGDWAPASGTFEKDPKRYLDYWREWAKSRK